MHGQDLFSDQRPHSGLEIIVTRRFMYGWEFMGKEIGVPPLPYRSWEKSEHFYDDIYTLGYFLTTLNC